MFKNKASFQYQEETGQLLECCLVESERLSLQTREEPCSSRYGKRKDRLLDAISVLTTNHTANVFTSAKM